MIGARMQLSQQMRMCSPQRLIRKRRSITHSNGVGRVYPHYPTILDPHTGHTITRGCHNIGITETNIGRAWSNEPIPVLRSRLIRQTKMPLAYSTGSIACSLEEVGHGLLFGTDNHACIARSYTRIVASPAIMSRQ